ncbi:uncharacterized protein LOC106644518 [Copidosoma floridanum]|uniref:uncharacterized protein LOC106644518 n=1 Tax=Copidosoma floridanum TaxID=29053 RepID=UPI0006C9BD5B|nr:uncharacterized protein LOC106644518 [Copidosoma floridanum]XP_014215547.1 uncharacterized protein LOC106644518 [Copidosoma floridanum]XP_014215549.1 uncharacterized protein LOC106644518 [Copidosoma floridanum]XP_014215550.1 uncharacterized protein LOC106644518 [Copidosoma floridanum]XP_023247138.1 uncharacterized protein LOC106644518 [Copidosoma floridanum]
MDSSEYEMVRNMTLLFFFERLMDKGGPRSLHDLSCQFGAKGFTKEMRQIAGGSQSGLKKFLAQYPVLFRMDGDYVGVNAMQAEAEVEDGASPGVKKRDYAQEAVEYFSHKLLQYGEGTEVPIKSLLGHRSQASPEVRHISGQHFREFKDFLARYPDAFVVIEDNVVLKQYEGVKAKPFRELEPDVSMDPEVTARLLDFLEHCIEQKGVILVDQLFAQVVERFPEGDAMFKTQQDLSAFLKMTPDAFHVQSNLVTFIGRPRQQQKDKSAASTPNDHQQPNDRTARNNNNSSRRSNHVSPRLMTNNSSSSQPESLTSSNNSASSTQPNSLTSPHEVLIVNNINNSNNSSVSPPVSLQQQTLKQRINSLLIKTLAENTERDRSLQNAVIGEALKSKVSQQTKVVVSVKDCSAVVDELMYNRKSMVDGKCVVSFDCEGINLGLKGKITVMQIGTMSGQVYVFDLITCPNILQYGGLRKLLESDAVVKVMHDCRNDSVTLFYQYGITLANVFDTQAAHSVIEYQNTGKPVYKVKNATLNTLCEFYGAPCNMLKEQVKNIYRRDQRYWARRPLTRDMIAYASSDVQSLVPLIYNAMAKSIKPEMQKLFAELCEEQVLMHVNPTEVKTRKKQRKIETEVADLRRKMDESVGRTIVLSNREIRLLRYLELTKEEKDKLKGSYKVAKKLEKLESMGQDRNENSSGEDDDEDEKTEETEFPSLDSYTSENSHSGGVMSPRNLEPPSLTESMQMVDEILEDGSMDGFEKIERLEAILSAVTGTTNDHDSTRSSPTKCPCMCQAAGNSRAQQQRKETACQTLSTGDIVITRIFFTEEEEERERLLNSPK